MTLDELLNETATAGATGAGAVATSITGFGGENEEWRSIYSSKTSNKKRRKTKNSKKMNVIKRPSPV